MNNTNDYGVSVKDYASQRSKTVQAVYQQMKRPENAAALEGHILIRRVGNKDVKYLDDVAVAILDEGSNSTQSVILQEDLKADLEEVNNRLQITEKQLFVAEGQILALKDLLKEKELELRALAEPQSQIDFLKAQNTALSGENESMRVKVAETEKNASEAAQKAQSEISSLEAQNAYLSSQNADLGDVNISLEETLRKAEKRAEDACAAFSNAKRESEEKETMMQNVIECQNRRIADLENRTLIDYIKALFGKKGKNNGEDNV